VAPNLIIQLPNDFEVEMVTEAGSYIGKLDANGRRTGKGKCTWEDGSVYEGDWLNNNRHG